MPVPPVVSGPLMGLPFMSTCNIPIKNVKIVVGRTDSVDIILTSFRFNITVHQSAGHQWVMWQGTGGNSWKVGEAGVVVLAD